LGQRASGDWIRSAKLALLSFLILPLTVLIHELGHFSIAVLSGLPAQLHASSVSGGAELGRAPAWMVACQVGAGPLATLLMSIGGAILYGRDPARHWALALALSAASRFLMPTAYLGARFLFLIEGRNYTGRPVFDEHDFAVAVGLPAPIVAAAATSFLFGLTYWLLRRTDRKRRLPFALALIVGIGAGSLFWPAIAPPLLASYPGR
jgi:uncharacterized membrane protein YfcA